MIEYKVGNIFEADVEGLAARYSRDACSSSSQITVPLRATLSISRRSDTGAREAVYPILKTVFRLWCQRSKHDAFGQLRCPLWAAAWEAWIGQLCGRELLQRWDKSPTYTGLSMPAQASLAVRPAALLG